MMYKTFCVEVSQPRQEHQECFRGRKLTVNHELNEIQEQLFDTRYKLKQG